VTRLLDRMLSRYGDSFWEGEASGAAVMMTSYGSPDAEKILPQLAAGSNDANGSNPVVFSAMSARIALFSEARLQLQSMTDMRLFGNQSLHLLEHPWPDATTGDLLARMEQDAGLAGNAYVWAPPGEGLLVRWRPDWVTIISRIVEAQAGDGWYRQKIGFHFEPPAQAQAQHGPPMFAPLEEVAHWAPTPDPEATFRGMSWLTPVMREIHADSGLTTYKIQYLSNAASPNLLIRYASKLHPSTVDSIRERVTARYGGTSNAFRTLVLDQGADATVIGNSLSQMNFDTVQSAGAERILAASGVPGIVVGIESLKGAGRSYQEVIRRFADLTMRPEWRSACGALQKHVPGLPPSGIRLWYDTSDIAALQEGEQQRAQESLIRAQALLTLRNAGYTRDSAVRAVTANDVSQLVADPLAAMPAQVTAHLLPQPPGSGPGVAPLPAGSVPRLPVGTVSPGDGGNATRPGSRPASVRRALPGSVGPRTGMISLDLPPGTVPPVPDGVTDQHVTVIYLGPDVDDAAMSRAREAVIAAASDMRPVDAVVHGVGAFPPGDDGRPVYAHVTSPAVHDLHRKLADLESPDSKAREFGYKPHVTLRYQREPDAPLPPPVPETPVTFTHLSIHRGDQSEYYPFGRPSAALPALAAANGHG